MSLEDMSRRARARSKKRAAYLAQEGTTPKARQIETNEAIAARETQKASRDVSASQFEAKKFPEPGEGIFCGAPGCGLTITGTLNDLVAHRATHA